MGGCDDRRMTTIRCLAGIIALLGLAAGCTAAPKPDLPDVVIGTATGIPAPNPSASPVPEMSTHIGRLAVLDDLGTLSTLAPDGSDRVVLAEAVEGMTLARQPTWSPDGSRLAWVQLEASGGGVAASLETTTGRGDRRTHVPTSVAPFYLSWDPTSSRIAYLGSSPTSAIAPVTTSGIELGIVEVAGGGPAEPLDSGSPFYLSWDPSGEELLVHVGTDRLQRLRLDGSLATVDERPGTFNAPVWTPDGQDLVFASRTGGRERLVVYHVEDGRRRELIRFDGGIRFVVSPDGTRIAFELVGGSGGTHPLKVIDRETGTVERVGRGTALAFFWSPAGDRLLYLYEEPGPDPAWLRWGVWDGRSAFGTPRFYPTAVFARDYLQFFEQYAQSLSLWAPDGSAFVYAGIGGSGEQGIWVQDARPGAEPVLVADGVFAAWSPT